MRRVKRRLSVLGGVAFWVGSAVQAQSYSGPYVRQGDDAIFYSQLDNPEVASTFVLGSGQQLKRHREASNYRFETLGFSTWTSVEVVESGSHWFSTVNQMTDPFEPGWPNWDDWAESTAFGSTWTTSVVDYLASEEYQLGPGDAAEIISFGIRLGDGVSRVNVLRDNVSDPNTSSSWSLSQIEHTSLWTLEDDVLLVPISVVDVRPDNDEETPLYIGDRIPIFADLFDGQRDWTLEPTFVSTDKDLYPQGGGFERGTAHQVEIIEDSGLPLGVPRRVYDLMRPDEVLAQCGVQFRMVEYVRYIVPQWVYAGEFEFGTPGDPDCADIDELNLGPLFPENYCLVRRNVSDHTNACQPGGFLEALVEIGKYQIKWSPLGFPPAIGKGQENQAGEVSSGEYRGIPVVFSGALNIGTGPNCHSAGSPYEGLTVIKGTGSKFVGLFEYFSTPNTLAHELYHAVSERGNIHNTGTLMSGNPTETWIPGCSEWRTDGQTPYGCKVATDQAANLEDYSETCSALRSGFDDSGSLPVPPSPEWTDMESTDFGFKPWTYGRWYSVETAKFSSLSSTSGDYALEVPLGYTEIVSPSFHTAEWGTIGDKLLLDVRMPAQLNNPYWAGNIALRFENPATGTYVSLGQRELNLAPLGEWSTLEYDVPESVQQVLLGDHPAAVFVIVVNTSDGAAQGQFIDSLRFGGNLIQRSSPHRPSSSHLDVRTNSFLDFENLGEWASDAATYHVVDLALSGVSALGLEASAGWNVLSSRTFATAELPDPTSTLSVDVYIPTPQPNPWWTGSIQLFLTCEDAGYYNQMIGQVELQNLFHSEYNQLEFMLSDPAHAVLSGDYFNCRFEFTVNSSPDAGKFIFDRMGYIE